MNGKLGKVVLKNYGLIMGGTAAGSTIVTILAAILIPLGCVIAALFLGGMSAIYGLFVAFASIILGCIFFVAGLASAVLAAIIGILAAALTLILSFIPVIYISTNLCMIGMFTTQFIALPTLPLSLSLLGVLGLSLIATNILIDLIIGNFVSFGTSDSLIFSVLSSIGMFLVVAVPTFFICSACGLPLVSPGLLSGHVGLLSAFLPTNALNISFLTTATLVKLPLSSSLVVTMLGGDQVAENHKHEVNKDLDLGINRI